VKKAVLAAAAVGLTVAAGMACAADLSRTPYYTAAAPLGAYAWAGPYLGVNLGYQWGYTTSNPTTPAGPAGGAQAGYNWQTGRFVFGGEADMTFSGADDTFAPWKFANPWFGALRARAGFAFNNVLLYGALGLALGGLRVETAGGSETKTHAGWTVGGGVEVGVTQSVSARVEYLYVDLADQTYALTGATHGLASHLVRLGVNYRF
jgi:outer membrane immunogenic protein